MENMQEKCLTLEDKAKLKERLALLRKEYNRTVNRLQKSERAEKVKTHVKRTIEEQNRLLTQEYTEQNSCLLSADPENCTSNASGDLGELHQILETPSADKERKLCVSFNLEPKIVNSDNRSPSCSGGESSGQEADGNRVHQSSQISRSRLRLSRSARRVCFSESPSPSVFRVSNIVNVLDEKKCTVDKSLSPVFKKHRTDGVPLRPDSPTASYCPEDSKPKDIAHEIAGPSGTALFRLGTADNSPGEVRSNFESQQSVGAEITTPNEQHFMENTSIKSETKKEQPLKTSKSLDVEVTCNSTCDFLVTPPQALEPENHTDLKRPTQVSPPLSSQNQPPPTHKTHTEHNVAKEDHSPLSSCTLVEGLLFPVEYYVRTTRRMTSCQRKVDLEAVISSHLLTGRKGSRGRSRRNSTSLSTPVSASDNSCYSLTPLSRPSVSNSAGEVTRSRRGRGRKSCPAALSSGLKDVSVQLKFGVVNSSTLSGSQSEKENCEEASSSKESHSAVKCLTSIMDGTQIKENDRFITLLSDKKAYSLRSQKATVFNIHTSAGDEDSKISNFQNSKKASEPTDSPLPVFSDRISLDRLSHNLKITDFHLPDEDFGVLKLEKLKSVNHLEPFTPHTPREIRQYSQHPNNDSNTLLPAGSSAVLQESNPEAYSQIFERALNLLETNEHCLNVDPTSCNKDTLENNIEPSADAAEPSHSLISEPTSALPLVVEVLDSNEKISHSPKKDFSINQFPDDDNPRHTSCIPERPLPDHEIPPNILAIPTCSLSDGEVQALIPLNDVSGDAETLWANLDSHRSIESNVVPTDSPTQSNIPGKLSSPKELKSSVLFSTSLCSVPLETMNDFVASSCTPGLPFLGSTPAIFSSLHGSNTSVTCSLADERQQKVFLPEVCSREGPEFMSLRCMGGAGDIEDSKQCHDVLGQDDNMMVEGHCQYLEHQNSLLSKADKDRSVYVLSKRADNEDTEVETGSGGRLRLLSEIKDSCGGGCTVDLCPVWWEFSGSPELCIVAASESSVCLWRPQTEGNWDCAHTWSFTEMPVIQILPLSQEKNIVCVALGSLEIMEIWALFSPPERLGWEKQLVKRGHMKTAQGLSRHRLVSSGEHGQVVEVQQLSETGSTVESLSLVPPRDSVLAFCEVEGKRDALVGSTMDTYVVVWNAVTGHLLSTIYVGDHCSDLTCLSATSDSGLLFLVVSSLFGKPCEDAGSCIFKLIATNPQGGANTPIMSYVIPDKPSTRYQEGDVKRQKAAAVLTCGSIALWDIPRSHCSVTLPPSLDAPWCLVRWSHSPYCLLTGRKDGTICIYEYTEHCSDKER